MSSAAPSNPDAAEAEPSAVCRAALLVAERWAEAVKAQAIYPAGHHRVARSLAQLKEALAAARAGGAGTREPATRGALRIVFADGGVLLDGERQPVDPDGALAWLRERLDHAALAGVDVLPEALPLDFERFGRRLLDVYATKDPNRDSAALWEGLGTGLRLLNRRFEGLFNGRADDTRRTQRTWGGLGPPLDPRARTLLVETLRTDPTIRARLQAIRQRLAAADRGAMGLDDADGGVELLTRLASLLPARAAEDARRLRAVTGGLLDALELHVESTGSPAALGAFFEDPALERRVAFLCTSLFQRDDMTRTDEQKAAQETRDAQRAQGHAGDDRVSDDLAAFLFELSTLPGPTEAPSAATEIASDAEQLAVLLHVVVHNPAAERLAGIDPCLRSTLDRAGPDALPVLKRVLAALAQRADDAAGGDAGGGGGGHGGLERLIAALRRVDALPLLRRSGHLDAGRVVDAFPRDFSLWLDTLDLRSAADRTELVDVLQRIGSERVRAAREALGGTGGALTPAHVGALLGVPHPALAPVVRVLFERGGPELKPAVGAWLRRLGLNGREACLLELYEDAGELPEAYLGLVFDVLDGRAPGRSAEALIVGLLSRFVRGSAGRPERRVRRIQALHRMAEFDLPEVDQLLSHVAYGRRWLVLPLEEKPVRLAAREALSGRGAA